MASCDEHGVPFINKSHEFVAFNVRFDDCVVHLARKELLYLTASSTVNRPQWFANTSEGKTSFLPLSLAADG